MPAGATGTGASGVPAGAGVSGDGDTPEKNRAATRRFGKWHIRLSGTLFSPRIGHYKSEGICLRYKLFQLFVCLRVIFAAGAALLLVLFAGAPQEDPPVYFPTRPGFIENRGASYRHRKPPKLALFSGVAFPNRKSLLVERKTNQF